MEVTKSKAAYAAFLLQERDPFKAACMLCPDNTGDALWYATNWANDAEVLAELNKLRSDGKNIQSIASKHDLARFYWDMANDTRIEAKDRIAAAEKYGAVSGIHDPKANNTTNINIDNAPRVMVVKDHGSDDAWQAKIERQQRELVNGKYVANTKQH